jgi:hypothetical protein
MPFRQAYRNAENCVFAVVQKFHRLNAHLPSIIGTAFMVSPNGLAVTCQHVVDIGLQLNTPQGYTGLPFHGMMWREVTVGGVAQWAGIPFSIHSHGGTNFQGPPPSWVQGASPDVAFLLLPFRGNPHLQFASDEVEIGEMIAFSGFPMGNRVLQGYNGGLRQESSTLHWGIVSSIHPHRLHPSPYGFLVHANTQGGASGSPVYRPDGDVVGMVYMGIPEIYIADPNNPQNTWYRVPTALTGCISGRRIAEAFVAADKQASQENSDKPLLDDLLAAGIVHNLEPGEGIMEPYTDETAG